MLLPPRGLHIIGRWLHQRLGLASFTYHVPAYGNSLPYLLGGITLVGILVIGASGIYLAQFYHPDPAEAHASSFFIVEEAPLGDFVRGVHFWASNLVMGTLFLHVLRVFGSKAFRPPREALWLMGLGLLVLMLGLFFTGTILKWDQEAFEALEHNEAMGKLLGGLGAWFTGEFSAAVSLLMRVYVAHVAILPALLLFLVAGHLLLIRIHGMAPPPGREAEVQAALEAANRGEAAPTVSHFDVHLRRLLGFGLLATALAGLLALVLAPPLGPAPTPGIEVTKPSWVFVWLYPFENWWGLQSLVWIPTGLLLGLAAVPFAYSIAARWPRWQWFLLVAWATILAAIIALGFYGWLTTPMEHLMREP